RPLQLRSSQLLPTLKHLICSPRRSSIHLLTLHTVGNIILSFSREKPTTRTNRTLDLQLSIVVSLCDFCMWSGILMRPERTFPVQHGEDCFQLGSGAEGAGQRGASRCEGSRAGLCSSGYGGLHRSLFAQPARHRLHLEWAHRGGSVSLPIFYPKVNMEKKLPENQILSTEQD
ncbi:hypothetical protein AMECASPLE_029111, partial [Ameca splendens]